MVAKKTNRQAGYNLVEVLIAMALLAVVLLGIMTLFVLGRGNIYSGKQMTHLVSVGTRAMEDISAMTADDLYANFNIPDGTALSSVTVNPSNMPESTYAGSILRSTASVTTAGVCGPTPTIVFANDPKFYLRNWWCQLQGTAALPSSSISLVITPRVPNPSSAAISVGPTGSATVIRARLIIRWSEGLRPRQMILDTTKYNRPLAD